MSKSESTINQLLSSSRSKKKYFFVWGHGRNNSCSWRHYCSHRWGAECRSLKLSDSINLLDTHVSGFSKLRSVFCEAITQAQKNNGVLISAISIWEVGMLAEKKRIQLDMDALDWVLEGLDFPGMRLVHISPKIAIQSTRLPGIISGRSLRSVTCYDCSWRECCSLSLVMKNF